MGADYYGTDRKPHILPTRKQYVSSVVKDEDEYVCDECEVDNCFECDATKQAVDLLNLYAHKHRLDGDKVCVCQCFKYLPEVAQGERTDTIQTRKANERYRSNT